MGNMHECKKNQVIFSDIMWKFYEEYKEKEWKILKNILDVIVVNTGECIIIKETVKDVKLL